MIPGLPPEPPPGTPGGPGYIIPGMPGSPEYRPLERRMRGGPGPGRGGKRCGWALLAVVAFAVLFVAAVVWIAVVGFNLIGHG